MYRTFENYKTLLRENRALNKYTYNVHRLVYLMLLICDFFPN